MTLDELRNIAAQLFPLAVANAVAHPDEDNAELRLLKQHCWKHFKSQGFDCMADCFAAVVPRSENALALESWSSAELKLLPWSVRVQCRALYLGNNVAHLEIQHDGPLPGITETGYRSMFVPMATFARTTPDGFMREQLSGLPRNQQLTLF